MPRPVPPQHLVDWLAAALVGALALLASNLLVAPATVPFAGHGERFAAMVEQPLAFTGEFPQRVLWPLLAHVAGWFGLGPVGFSQSCSGALLTVVCWFARRRGLGWLDAVLLTAAVAGTGAVQVYKPMACFSDTLNLLLLVLTVHFVARPRVFWCLVALASFSHEMVLFFAPWLVWLRLRNGGGIWWREGLAMAACGALHCGWRLLVGSLGHAAYDASYYAKNNFWVPWGMPALWALWGLVVLAEFGPLLAVGVWSWRTRVHGLGGRLGPWLYFGCVLSLMVFAYDVMRFATFVFVPLLLGGVPLLRARHGRQVFAALLLLSLAAHASQHPVPSQQGGAAFTAVSESVLPLLPSVAPSVLAGKPMSAGEGYDYTLALLQQRPTIWWWTLFAACSVLGGGLLLARYVRPVVAAGERSGSTPRTTQNASP